MKRLLCQLLTILQLPALLLVGVINIIEGVFVGLGCIGFIVITALMGVVGGVLFIVGMVLLFGLVRILLIPYISLLEIAKQKLSYRQLYEEY